MATTTYSLNTAIEVQTTKTTYWRRTKEGVEAEGFGPNNALSASKIVDLLSKDSSLKKIKEVEINYGYIFNNDSSKVGSLYGTLSIIDENENPIVYYTNEDGPYSSTSSQKNIAANLQPSQIDLLNKWLESNSTKLQVSWTVRGTSTGSAPEATGTTGTLLRTDTHTVWGKVSSFSMVITYSSGLIHYWNGSQWVEGELKYWDGTKWVDGAELKYWNGNKWVEVE